ncbi:PP2C family protein-serine/threonine phosphatase [Jatrophihabitans sp. YIM 134969]
MAIALRYAVRSDKGLVRGNNEDSVYAGPRLLAIADGMGGHAAGEVASTTVINALERLDEDHPVEDLLGDLRSAFEQANRDVANAVDADPALDGMGTTLTALRFSGSRVGLVHVGDSRAYLARAGTFAQITHDDTYVQSLVDSGKLTEEEAQHHPRKSVILRAITGTEVEPDVSIREARVGDRYLLCSDGLSDVVSAETLAETLMEGDPQECADRLVDLALRGGGPDNVTCIVADVVERDNGTWNDDLPVIGGALDADDGLSSEPASDDTTMLSAAERAATLTRPAAEPATDRRPVQRSNHRRRNWILAFSVVVVLGGAAVATYLWTQTQYYVGESGLKVAIFRGVNSSLGPLQFSQVEVSTDVDVDDLQEVVRTQVRSGITAKDRGDAQQIVDRISTQLLPFCPTPSATSSPSVTVSSTGATARSTPPRTTPRTTAPTSPGRTPASSSAGTSTSSSPSATPSVPTPGVDCRERG